MTATKGAGRDSDIDDVEHLDRGNRGRFACEQQSSPRSSPCLRTRALSYQCRERQREREGYRQVLAGRGLFPPNFSSLTDHRIDDVIISVIDLVYSEVMN